MHKTYKSNTVMKYFYLLITGLFLFSCAEKTIQLPETHNKDILKVKDVSAIYMFYNEERDSLEFNTRNMISSTNWLVAIDKRLSLKKTVPHLQYLQGKRQGESLHKNEEANNYFSCSNPEIQNLALIKFTDVVYRNEPIVDVITDLYSKSSDIENNILINFLTKDSLIISGPMFLKGIQKNLLVKTIDSISTSNAIKSKVHLTFNENLSFQDYITYKTLMLDVKSENVRIANDEFIYK